MASQKGLPERRSRVGRVLFWGLVSLMTGGLLFLLIWKWDTLGYILNADSIRVKSRQEILSALEQDGYTVYGRSEDGISYRVLNDRIDVNVVFTGDELSLLDVSFNYNSISIRTVDEAAKSADLLLGPFFTKPEIEAIIVLLGSDLSTYASDNAIHCTVPLAGYSLRIDGDQKYGDVRIVLS